MMNNELERKTTNAAISFISTALAVGTAMLSMFSCVMSLGYFGFKVTLNDAALAYLVVSFARMKISAHTKEKTIRAVFFDELGCFSGAAVVALLIWLCM